MIGVYKDLLERGTRLGPGCSGEELAAFQERWGVAFPAEFIELWSMVNGTDQLRDSGVRLWTLDEIGPVEESPFGSEAGASLWVIADYMAGTHGYAMSLDSSTFGSVYLVDGMRVERIAPDLERFVVQTVLG